MSASEPPNSTESDGLGDVLNVLRTNPAGFILGTILGFLADVVSGGLEALVDAVTVVFLGSNGAIGVDDGLVGIADLPVFTVDLVAGPTSDLAEDVLRAEQQLVSDVVGTASATGPFEPVVLALFGAIAVAALGVLARRLLSLVPGRWL